MTKDHFKNINDCFNVFKIIGIYRPKGVHIGHKIYGNIFRFVVIDLFLLFEFLEFSKVKNIFEFADLLSVFLSTFTAMIKSYILSWKFEEIENFIDELKKLLIFAEKNRNNFGNHIEKRMIWIRKVFIIFWMSCPLTIVTASITSMLFIKDAPYQPPYRQFQPKFFDFYHNYSYFLIMCVYQIFPTTFAATTSVAAEFLSVYFFSISAGLFEELSDRFSDIKMEISKNPKLKMIKENPQKEGTTEMDHDEMTMKELKHCIEIHIKLKEFIPKAQKLVSPLIFVQVMSNTTVICMICYTISMVSIKKFLYRFTINILTSS